MERARQRVVSSLTIAFLAFVLLAATAASTSAQMAVTIEYTPNGIAGRMIEVPITLSNPAPGQELGGFDFLFEYHEALLFQTILEGDLIAGCNWEYFSHSEEGDHLHRIVAMANAPGGSQPTCYADQSGELARLRFMILLGEAVPGDSLPIRFWWMRTWKSQVRLISMPPP